MLQLLKVSSFLVDPGLYWTKIRLELRQATKRSPRKISLFIFEERWFI